MCGKKLITYDNKYAHIQRVLSSKKAVLAPRKPLHKKK